MSLKPWEAGYVAPEPAPVMSKVEAGRLGGQTHIARRQAGLPPLPPKKSRPGPEPDPTSAASLKAEWESEENISDKRRMFLDRFIDEYVHDFNAPMAYIRAGGSSSHASSGGPEALRSKYVQTHLKNLRNYLQDKDIVNRADVIMGLKREANHYGADGGSAARTRAWTQLSKILGIEAPAKTEQTVTHKGGVMLVPVAPSVDAWENAAQQAQLDLKNDVRK